MEVEYQYTDGGQISAIIARDLTQGTATDIYCQEFEYDENGRKTRQVQKEKESDADTSAYYGDVDDEHDEGDGEHEEEGEHEDNGEHED